MNAQSLLAPIAAGLIGALVWGAVAAVSGYELGLVAWLIGGMVGGAAILAGGRGRTLAVACAIIAAVSIIGGKLATSFFLLDSVIESDVEEKLRANFTAVMHESVLEDARQLDTLTDSAAYANFMVENGYDSDGVVTADDLNAFRTGWLPLLREWQATPLSLEESRDRYVEHFKPLTVQEIRKEVTHSKVLLESIHFHDILFLVFGIATAFGIVARKSGEEAVIASQLEQLTRPRLHGQPGTQGLPLGDAQQLPGMDARPRPPTQRVPSRPATRPVVPRQGPPKPPGMS